MIAAVLFGPRDIRIIQKKIPQVSNEEVLIKVEACAICGSDIKMFNKPWDPHPAFGEYVIGHEFSGIIVEQGEAVHEYIDRKPVNKGDRIAIQVHKGCGKCENCIRGMYTACLNFGDISKGHYVYGITVNGGFAQYTKVHISNLFKLPDNISFEEATLVTNAGCGLYGIESVRSYITNEDILITGPGPIGLMVVQLCKAYSANRIILTGTRDYRLNLGKFLGADNTININNEEVFQKVMDLTNNQGVNLSIECTGKREGLLDCINSTRRGGEIILLGLYEDSVSIDIDQIVKKNITMYGIRGEGLRACGKALSLMSQGKIVGEKLITHTFSLRRIEEAFHLYENRIENPIKVIIYPNK